MVLQRRRFGPPQERQTLFHLCGCLGLGHQRIRFGIGKAAVVDVAGAGHQQIQIVFRIVFAKPAGLGDLEIPLPERREMRVELGVVQCRLYANGLPHGGDGHLHLLVVDSGDVAQRDAQGPRFVVAGLCEQHGGRGRVAGLRFHRALVVRNHRRHERCAVYFAALQHFADEDLPVYRQRQRPSHAGIVERRLGDVEDQIHHGEQRRKMQMVRHSLAQPADLARWKIADDVQFVVAVAAVGGASVCRRKVADLRQPHALGGMEVRVLAGPHEAVRLPSLQHESAVADHVARFHPVIAAEPPDHMFRHRKAGGIGETLGQKREGFRQPNPQHVIAQRFHAQAGWRLLAGVHILRALDGVEEEGEAGGRVRVQQALEREDEILGGERCAIGPASVFAQLERPGEAVRRGLPTVSDSADHAAVGVVRGQPLEQVGENLLFQIQVVAVGIQGQRFAAVADTQFVAAGFRTVTFRRRGTEARANEQKRQRRDAEL